MHNAPPVVFPVGRFVWGRRVVWMLAFCGALGLGFWQLNTDVSGFIWTWALWGTLLGVALYAPSTDILSDGFLVWTGELWWWRDAQGREIQVELRVLLDLGSALGLVLRPAQGAQRLPPQFVWLDSHPIPQMWHGLRCAVYSRRRLEQKSGDHADDVQ